MKKFECYCGCGRKPLKVQVGVVNYYSRKCVERVQNKAFYPFKLLTNKEYKDFHSKEKVGDFTKSSTEELFNTN